MIGEQSHKEIDNKLKNDLLVTNVINSENLISKYQLEEHLCFLVALFSDLPRAFATANVFQKRTLLCSIWPSGLSWNYPGLSNTTISPVYEAIKSLEMPYTSGFLLLGAVSDSWLEHLLEWIKPLLTAFPNYKLLKV